MKPLNIVSLVLTCVYFDFVHALPGRGSHHQGPGNEHSNISPDGTCGGQKGFNCHGSEYGDCCSQYNWCGGTKAYCGHGCQGEFGTCSLASSSPSSPSPSPSKPSASSSPVSEDCRCGKDFGTRCADGCCSQYGWCGSTGDYCGVGCQAGYGLCENVEPSSSTLSSRFSSPSKSHAESTQSLTSLSSHISTLRSSSSLSSSPTSSRPQNSRSSTSLTSLPTSSLISSSVSQGRSIPSITSSVLLFSSSSTPSRIISAYNSSILATSTVSRGILSSGLISSSRSTPQTSSSRSSRVAPSSRASSSSSGAPSSSRVLSIRSTSSASSSTRRTIISSVTTFLGNTSSTTPSSVPTSFNAGITSSSSIFTSSTAQVISSSSSSAFSSTSTSSPSSSATSSAFSSTTISSTINSLSSSTSSSASASSSAATCPTYPKTGYISVLRNSVLQGYIQNSYDDQNSVTFGSSLSTALQVQFTWAGDSCTNPTNVAITMLNIQWSTSSFNYLGLVGGSGGDDFSSGHEGYAYMAGTAYVAPNSPPSSSAGNSIEELGYNGPSETSVWSYNFLTGSLTLQWTNDDGTQPATHTFYDPSVNFIGAVGDLATFNAVYPGEGAYLVDLVLIETEPMSWHLAQFVAGSLKRRVDFPSNDDNH